MGFPSAWLNWIKACFTSISSYFLNNGQPSKWISPSRGVRQGDPLFPYLFIIVSQNLTTILNHAQSLNLVPGFSLESCYNFNHIMYVDDLIIVMTITRKAA